MSEFQAEDFLETMKEENPDIIDLPDAVFYAMNNITVEIVWFTTHSAQYKDITNAFFDEEPRWFGMIGGGTFFMDSDHMLWFPETSPAEAVLKLVAD